MSANQQITHDAASAPDWADDAEARVLEAAIRLAPALRWNGQLVKAAAKAAGVSEADAMLLLPKGAADLAALLFRRHDTGALAHLATLDPANMKVRERIQAAVSARIDAAMADEEAVKSASAYLATPMRAPLALSLGWASADKLWRWAGDTATDENHYSKRAILGGVLFSTMAARLSGGKDKGEAHLKARIDDVMAFEKWKARFSTPVVFTEKTTALFARLRYGARSGSAR